jgi:hypothetical protein
MTEKYNVYVRFSDGKHKISKLAESLEAATKTANEWLGPIATWQGPMRAVCMHGSVLTIEAAEERATRTNKATRTVEELQDVLNSSDVADIVREIRDAFENAESCETREDFQANMRELLTSAKSLVAELKTVLG